ncbi:hypothetical protein [Halococcus sp. AFM35]|uniref:hypothetical protein n=1 Tax=Halococcus sp. AFM35 TaxID=3421653 RepID=UPI003EB75A02
MIIELLYWGVSSSSAFSFSSSHSWTSSPGDVWFSVAMPVGSISLLFSAGTDVLGFGGGSGAVEPTSVVFAAIALVLVGTAGRFVDHRRV